MADSQFTCHCAYPAEYVIDSYATFRALQHHKNGHFVRDDKHSRWAVCAKHLSTAIDSNEKRLKLVGSLSKPITTIRKV